MTGAMYAAVSGMRAHMNKLNVISNNVANVNTYGYKSASMSFQEALYTTSKSGSNGTPLSGGINPAQIGYGVKVGTIDLDMSAKNFMPTGSDLDCMITGDGFFMVGPKLEDPTEEVDPSSLMMTRVGKFSFDSDGYLIDNNGNVVYGFSTCSDTEGGGTIAADGTGQYAPANPDQTPGVSTKLAPIRLPLAAKAGLTGTKEGAAIYPSVDDEGNTIPPDITAAGLANAENKCVVLESISIGTDGEIRGVNKAGGATVVVGYVPIASVANPSGVTHMGGPYYRALGGAGDTQVSTVGNVVQGYLGNKEAADATALDNIIGTGETELATGGIESSGTDVATEFSEMIVTQRGYQANTRIITVTDTMLEELVNIKR